MKILAFDLSSARGGIAFIEGGAELFAASFANDRKHSGHFFAQLQACTRACGPPDRIAVGLGPGSYAGTRIAIAAAIGLRAANDAELTGIASVRAVDTDVSDYIVIGDARRNSFFYAHVRARYCSDGPLLCTGEELRQRLRATELPVFSTELIKGFESGSVAFPSAVILARIAAIEGISAASASPLEPIYLREAHITPAKPVFANRSK